MSTPTDDPIPTPTAGGSPALPRRPRVGAAAGGTGRPDPDRARRLARHIDGSKWRAAELASAIAAMRRALPNVSAGVPAMMGLRLACRAPP